MWEKVGYRGHLGSEQDGKDEEKRMEGSRLLIYEYQLIEC